MNDGPATYPTTSDIGSFMRELGYEWSNEAQIYYCKYDYSHISGKVAKRLYKYLIGDKPYRRLIKKVGD